MLSQSFTGIVRASLLVIKAEFEPRRPRSFSALAPQISRALFSASGFDLNGFDTELSHAEFTAWLRHELLTRAK